MVEIKKHIMPLTRLAVPVATSQVTDMLVSTVDVLMVGPLGAVPLAGVQIAVAASLIAMLFSIGFSAAITPLAGEAFGRRDMQGVARYARSGFLVSLVVTVLLCGILLLFSSRLDLLGSPPDVTAQAIPFFRWIVMSFVFRILFGAFKQTAEAMANTRVAMVINIGINVLNVFLCWVFVYGNLGMPQMGAEGAGFATFLARGLAVIAAWIVYARSEFFAEFRKALAGLEKGRVNMQAHKQILHDGAGIGMQILMEVMAFALGAIMLGWIGAIAVAAHGVAINVASVTFMVALGIGSAATIRVSNLRGEQRHADARNAANASLVMVIVYMLTMCIGYLTLRFWIPTLYVKDPAVIELAAQLLLFAGAFTLFDGLQVVGLGILRGYNDVKIPTVIAMVSYLGITIPASYVCAFVLGMGPAGIWTGYLAGLIAASAGYLFRYRHVVYSRQQIAGANP